MPFVRYTALLNYLFTIKAINMKHPDLNIKKPLLALAIILAVVLQHTAFASPYLVLDSNPWGSTHDQSAMDNVFGAGNWTQANTSTPAATIFQASTSFVMLEGSESNTNMPNFINANIALIESWVNAGGHLFMNAAPNYGTNQTWGFGSTTLTYPSFANSVTTSVPTDPIFTGPNLPTATSFTGTSFAHAWINGTGLTTLLYDQAYPVNARPVLAYKTWGSGVVFFGGCTLPGAWTPSAEGDNIWKNIVAYVNSINANCFSITCNADTTVYVDPNTCGAVVNFVPPAGQAHCPGNTLDTFFYTGNMVNYTVPAGVTKMHMRAIGAQGGNNGGRGADMQGDITVVPGDVLKIIVGGQGQTNFVSCNSYAGAGGGGGSFVTTSANVPLIVAGGGGGNLCNVLPTMDASISTSGNDGNSPSYPTQYGVGGVGGNGATNSPGGGPHGGNGGGFLTNGQTGQCAVGGLSFLSGGGIVSGCTAGSNGGFGGGGGGGNAGAGGGGGYSGGGGSYHYPGNGGGGGSYNSGANQVNALSTGTGDGMVIFTVSKVTTTLISGLPPGSYFPVGITNEKYMLNDDLGDTLYCSFIIKVSDTINPTIGCPSNVTTCTSVVTGIAPTLTGGPCTNVTYTMIGATTGSGVNDASGTNFNVGTTIVKYVATNAASGNADSCSFSVTVNSPTGLLAGNTITPESMNVDVVAPVDVNYTDCDLMASIIPSGISPVGGNTNVKVTIDNSTNTYNGQPYVRRHFDIEPSNNASTSTSTIKLYAYQYEFDAYNLAAGPAGYPLLPTGAVDNGNVRITQFHGVGTAPGNYSGSEELIIPAVNWDATYNRWVMTFNVTGFSGFYIHTGFGTGPLAIQIRDIKAINKGARNRVDWSTATEAKGDVMTLERSIDGISFTAVTDMYATGKASTYTYWDEKPATGINYYRVKFTDNSRRITYTNVVNATVQTSGGLAITASPNPVLNVVNVNVTGITASNGKLLVTDPTGKTVMEATIVNSTRLDMSSFPSGIYFIKYTDDSGTVTTRVTKQ